MFIDHRDYLLHILDERGGGAWCVKYREPSAPFWLSDISTYQRVAAPDDFVIACERKDNGLWSDAQMVRWEMIEPLVSDTRNISDSQYRAISLMRRAEQCHISIKTLRTILYRYWATGYTILPKQHTIQAGPHDATMAWAIQKLYFSSGRPSLHDAYLAMLIAKYTDGDGNRLDDVPTFAQFRYYYYHHGFHKRPQKTMGREGMSAYLRNQKPIYGTSMAWRDKIGAYQMDATTADIYLVSRLDRTAVIGRPNVYLAVDTATRLIAGIYVGVQAGERAVIACLQNAAEDKVEFCARYGINIEPEQWPSHGLPKEIITDKGKEFVGRAVSLLCMRYGMVSHSLPPFRPDRKGIVEKTFDLLQAQYKPLLRGRGVIEADAQERWATDYREKAILNLDEFTQIILHCVLYLNNHRVLSFQESVPCDPIPCQLWAHYESAGQFDLLDVADGELRVLLLPRQQITVTRRGLHCMGLDYNDRCLEENKIFVGDTVTVAYNAEWLREVYVIQEKRIIKVPLAGGGKEMCDVSELEYNLYHEKATQRRKELKQQQETTQFHLVQEIQDMITQVQSTDITQSTKADIEKYRTIEGVLD